MHQREINVFEACNHARAYIRKSTVKEFFFDIIRKPKIVFNLIRHYILHQPLAVKYSVKGNLYIFPVPDKILKLIPKKQQWYCIQWSSHEGWFIDDEHVPNFLGD